MIIILGFYIAPFHLDHSGFTYYSYSLHHTMQPCGSSLSAPVATFKHTRQECGSVMILLLNFQMNHGDSGILI